MKVLRQRKYLFALLALLVVFGGCRGEDPTAPPVGGGSGGSGGGTPPPVGATITLTASNPNPLAGSTTTITANVTVNNGPAPNGTAVEFGATGTGRFSDTGTTATIRTTTNGIATATLTSTTAGAVTVTAVVNNVQQQITVNFQTQTTTPPTPDAAPVITAVSPNQGRPEGGEIVTITGRNFRGPIRVFFDLGNGVQREAIVASATATQIQVLTPAVDLGAGQTQAATIVVFTEQGTSAETRLTAAFTFRRAVLTPRITTVSPDSGPISGGTRITIFGDGFEAPVQVSFTPSGGSAFSMMEVVNVTFNQIIAITPHSSAVNPSGSGPLTGPVDLRVLNINSATNVTLPNAFRYTPAVVITAVGPTQGTSLGGTRVQIDGSGFEDPVAVSLAGVGAQVVSVTGSRVIVVSSPLASPCTDLAGDVSVTNIENGDGDSVANTWQYVGVDPVIVGVSSAGPITPGSTVSVSVLNPGVGAVRIQAGSATLIPTPSVSVTGLGTAAFSIVLPTTGFTFPTVQCTPTGGAAGSGTQLGPVSVDLNFNNVTTGCTDTLPQGLTVQPPGPNLCQIPPTANVVPAAPTCANAPPVAAAAGTSNATITISNAANARDLIISNASVVLTGTMNGTAVIGPTTATIPAGASQVFTVTLDPAVAGPVTGNATFTTNDPQRASIVVCVTGSGT